MSSFSPEGNTSLRKQVIHKLGDGTMQSLHHRAEMFAGSQVAECVIVIVDKACDPRLEAEFIGIVVEAIPKNGLRLLAGEGWIAVTTAGGNKIDLIVDIPMLVAM